MKVYVVSNENGPVCAAESFAAAKKMVDDYVDAVGSVDAGELKIAPVVLGEFVKEEVINYWDEADCCF